MISTLAFNHSIADPMAFIKNLAVFSPITALEVAVYWTKHDTGITPEQHAAIAAYVQQQVIAPECVHCHWPVFAGKPHETCERLYGLCAEEQREHADRLLAAYASWRIASPVADRNYIP